MRMHPPRGGGDVAGPRLAAAHRGGPRLAEAHGRHGEPRAVVLHYCRRCAVLVRVHVHVVLLQVPVVREVQQIFRVRLAPGKRTFVPLEFAEFEILFCLLHRDYRTCAQNEWCSR